jgi:hypothetical protein
MDEKKREKSMLKGLHYLGMLEHIIEGQVENPHRNKLKMQEDAKEGVESITMTELPNGNWAVQIGADRSFSLSPTLAALLDVLTSDNGKSHDGLIGWKSRTEVKRSMTKIMRKSFKPQAINQNIYRLRERLEEEGYNRHYVMTNSKLGVRFALCRISPEPDFATERRDGRLVRA